MQVTFTNLLLAAGLLTSALAHDKCFELPTSCSALPVEASASCSSVISKSRVHRATCFAPSSTVTITKTTQPKTTLTAVTTWTRTMQITKHNAATTVDITTNAVQTDVIDWAYTEVFLDSVTTVTETEYDDRIDYYPRGICTAAPGGKMLFRRGRLERRDPLPIDCSCYLTTTKTSGVATSTEIQTLPTSTITKFITEKTTITINNVGTTLTETETSITATESITATYSFVNYASTATVTSTSTLLGPYCEYAASIKRSGDTVYRPESFGKKILKNTNFVKCCKACWENPYGCQAYQTDAKDSTCTLWLFNNKSFIPPLSGRGCATEMCPKGTDSVNTGYAKNGEFFGGGPCADGFQR